MIAIIENNNVHSVYNDDKAKILFNKYSLSELEYITYEIEKVYRFYKRGFYWI